MLKEGKRVANNNNFIYDSRSSFTSSSNSSLINGPNY